MDPKSPEPAAIEEAVEILLSGGLVAFPTETVYGLGALADDAAAIARIYAAKGRPSHNPVIAHVASREDARRTAGAWPAAAEALARAFWPGPLTLVVPRGARIPPELSAGLDTMAIRVPDHPVALALLRAVARPIAAPSANRSTEVSPTRAAHVTQSLGDAVELVLDAGPCRVGIESTVVDVTQDPPVVLRPGRITPEDIAAVLGRPMPRHSDVPAGAPHASPGMDARHYAPAARLVIAERRDIAALLKTLTPPVGLIAIARMPDGAQVHWSTTLPCDAADYGTRLYDSLHAVDAAGCASVVVEAPPSDDPSWDAVRDRLQRAAEPEDASAVPHGRT